MAAKSSSQIGDVSSVIGKSLSHPSILEDLENARKSAERDAIVSILASTLWNRKKAAALLKIDYKALLYKMKKLGIGGTSGSD
jgi:DNA-binding NtrC family response regulator